MTYYLLLPNDTEAEAISLGDESMGTFYPDQGMSVLNTIVNDQPEILEKVIIMNDNKKRLTLTEFFDILSKLTIRKLF